MLRRSFLQSAVALAPLSAQPAPIRLGIDTYSLRSFRWKLDQMLDYAERHKLDSIQASRVDFESFEEPYLGRIRERATRLGIAIEPGWGCISPVSRQWNPKTQGAPTAYLLEAIRVTRALGGRSCRVFAGGAQDRAAGVSIPALIESAIKELRTVRSQALDANVKIAIENHNDMQARHFKTIIEEAGKDFVGSCLDTGNPIMVAEDPLFTLETLAPYVVTTHIRDSVVFEHPLGAAAQWVALGDGVIDFKRFTARYRQLCPQAPFHLEIITGRPPTVLNFFEDSFWKSLPGASAAEFARFAAIARKGRPSMNVMIVADAAGEKLPDEYRAALREQERFNTDRSIHYAKNVLDVGVRWRS